jgi:hypothetical protein
MQIITPIHAFLKWFMGAKIYGICAKLGHRRSVLQRSTLIRGRQLNCVKAVR